MASNALLLMLGAWTLTYLAHSTLLLIAACLCRFAWDRLPACQIRWKTRQAGSLSHEKFTASTCLLCRAVAVRSHALRERVWKFAAVAGVVTAALAVFGGWGLAVSSLTASGQTQATIDLGAARPGTSGQGVQSERPSVDEASDTLASQSDTRAIPNWPDAASESSRLQSSVVSGKPLAAGRAFLPATSVLPLRDASEVTDSNSLAPLDHQLDVPITAEEYAAIEALLLADERLVEPAPDAAPIATTAAVEQLVESPSLWQRTVQTAPSVIGAIAVGWMLLGLLRVVLREIVLAKTLRCCRPVTKGVARRLLDDLMQRAGRRRTPRLLTSDDITEPMACGIWSPCIVLPTDCEQRLSREELRALLAHELAHLLRGDVVWLWIGRVLCSSFSFQPLNFVARRAWQVSAEVQCDDWAIEQDVSVVSLASCLAQVAEWQLDRSSSAVLTATSTGGPLTVRIERLLGERPIDVWKTRWRSRISLLAAFVLGIGFASVAPRFDESLWAREPTEADLESRMRLWNEITSELSAVQRALEQLPDSGREDVDQLRSRIRALTAKER